MFGLTGAHRTGKTTVAKAISTLFGIPFVDISATRLMKECGYDPVAPMAMDDRIMAQVACMNRLIDVFNEAPRPCITDRTPLDFVAYMTGEVAMLNTTPEQAAAVAEYQDLGIRATSNAFDTVITLRPLPSYQVEKGKPPENRAYQNHIQFIVEGLLNHLPLTTAIVFDSDHDVRIQQVGKIITERVEELAQERAAARLH